MSPEIKEAVRIVSRSGLLQPRWYLDRYPDVTDSGLNATQHYVLYGAAMGRDPGPWFNTRFYIAQSGVAPSEMNPIVHYVLHGRAAGLARRSLHEDAEAAAQARIDAIRGKLMSLGFTRQPLDELEAIVATDANASLRALAARELALWHIRRRTDADYEWALDLLTQARRDASTFDLRTSLTKLELMCHFLHERREEGAMAYERAALEGEVTTDVLLAWANLQPTPEKRLLLINEVLRFHGLAPMSLEPDSGALPYDRLTVTGPPPAVKDGQLVTVLMAAYDAAATIPTALRSLSEQSWRNLEILVLDDHSPTDAMAREVERAAAADPRIRLIQLETNGGAYVARNRGLQEARGAYVTLHDADDWSHPSKIEMQVRFLEGNTNKMGCTSQQARMREDLTFGQVRNGGPFICNNTSSFLFRRRPVQEALGFWDTVRFGADNEFIRRMQKVFGRKSIARLPSGPMSFQREAQSSVTFDSVKGITWGYHYYGVRKEYYDAQRHHHETALNLRYDGDPSRRPFPVPPMMRPVPEREAPVFDVIFMGDLRRAGPETARLVDEIEALRAAGRRVGLVEAPRYEEELVIQTPMCRDLRELVDGEGVRVLVFGEEVRTRSLVTVGDVSNDLRLLPRIHVMPSPAPKTEVIHVH